MIIKLKTLIIKIKLWDIVKSETNKGTNKEKICTLNVDGEWIQEKQMIAETFNNYFLSKQNKQTP
jgi:hypothetical protein